MEVTVIDIILMFSIVALSILFCLQSRKVADLKDSLMIVARNPARARRALREKYGDKRGL